MKGIKQVVTQARGYFSRMAGAATWDNDFGEDAPEIDVVAVMVTSDHTSWKRPHSRVT